MRDNALRLFTYHGKKPALMVTGTPTTMRKFAEELLQAIDGGHDLAVDEPVMIYEATVDSPYTDRKDYSLTFHLEEFPEEEGLFRKVHSYPTPGQFMLQALGWFVVACLLVFLAFDVWKILYA